MGLLKLQKLDPRISQGAKVGFGEAVGAGFESAFKLGSVAESQRHAEVYGDWRPILDSVAQGNMDPPEDLKSDLFAQDFHPDADTLARMAEWLATDGRHYDRKVTEGMSPDAVAARREEVYSRDQAIIEANQEVLSRAGPKTRLAGQLVGGVGAEFLDPLNLATMPAGASARAGLLTVMTVEAGINAGIEALDTQNRNAIARNLGQPETAMLENAALGAIFGATFPALMRGALKGGELTFRGMERLGRVATGQPAQLRQLATEAAKGADPEAAAVAKSVLADLDDADRAADTRDSAQVREHSERATAAMEAAESGGEPQIPDRPTFASARPSVIAGEIEEIDPRALKIEPEVFQFKSDIVAEGGVTEKLVGVQEWRPERAGIALVYEYADGSRAIADGHQRAALANRIMDETGDEIRLAGKVFRELDGFTVDDVRVLAALKNIAEAADGMTTAMARDAARVLRISPEAIAELPTGPGIARAKSLAELSDDAFDMYINEVVPERFAELVGRSVDDPAMHGPIMQLLARAKPETTAQAASIVDQAMQAPVSREVTADLFGEREIVESLYVERAKVLERAMRILRDDQSVFRVLDERADRIQGVGENRLDAQTNKQVRQSVERALAETKKLAHRAGPISEALNNGAKSYKETGRLKDAAEGVAEAVRQEVGRAGGVEQRAGAPRQDAEPPAPRAKSPDPLEGFSDPVEGEGAKAQIEATRIEAEPVVSEADQIAAAARERGASVSVSDTPDRLTVNKIVVPEGQRGQGVGTEVMQEIIDLADRTGRQVALTPSKDFGATSIKRLRDFYKRLGFVENKGRNKDFTTQEAMIREPQELSARAATERTEAGEQALIEGVEPITERQRLEADAAKPIDGGQAVDDTQIGGLFDPSDPVRNDLFDQVPVDRGFDADGNEIAVTKTRAELAAELDADDEAVAIMEVCVK